MRNSDGKLFFSHISFSLFHRLPCWTKFWFLHVLNSWGSLGFCACCRVDKSCLKWSLPRVLQHYCTQGKHMLLTWEIVCFRPDANKMVALKVPAVHFAICSQVKGNDCCKQRVSSCFVCWRCRISGLARFTDKPLFPEAKKPHWPFVTSVVFAMYVLLRELRNAWVDSMFAWV